MCSFLFTASGGKKCSDALKHDGKRYSSNSVLAEERPHSFTLEDDFHSIRIMKRSFTITELDLHVNLKNNNKWRQRLLMHTTNLTFVFDEQGRGEINKTWAPAVDFYSPTQQEAVTSIACYLAGSLLHRHTKRHEGSAHWRAAHNLFLFSPGKMTIQPCQMWIRSERNEHNTGQQNPGQHNASDKPLDTPQSILFNMRRHCDSCGAHERC